MAKIGKSAPPSFNSLDFFYCCPVKTKTRKKHLCSKRLAAFIMYCLSESLCKPLGLPVFHPTNPFPSARVGT
jgi:hypothetical protein